MVRHVVVDGSNIATEGRSMPSLKQLNEAVLAFMEENPDAQVTVVVDATFGHRIDPSERAEFEDAESHGELTSPPAGAIGRGDAFVLRIAEKVDAIVLSNDSFQEFHGEHEWLFDKGRLIGGKPVPGIGWVFTPRTPVRGPKSREAVKEAKRTRVRLGSKDASLPMPVPKEPPPAKAARTPRKSAAPEVEVVEPKGRRGKVLERAIAEAVEEAVEPEETSAGRRRRRKRKGAPPATPINDPATFLSFVASYQPGAEVDGTVESFSSHGAFVVVDGARCYVPLSAMGDPPPRAAREALDKGETRTFVVQAFDAPRRGIELALPGFVRPAGQPTEETVEAEIAGPEPEQPPAKARRSRKKAAAPVETPPADEAAETPAAPARRRKKAAAPTVAAEEVPAPAPTRGTRKKAAAASAPTAPEETPAAPARGRKKAAAPTVEAEEVPAPAPARRTRKKAAPAAPAAEAAPPAEAAPTEEAPTGPRRNRTRAAPAAPPAAEDEQAPAATRRRSRKKAAPTVVEADLPAEAAAPAPAPARTRKKAAEPAPAPSSRGRKRAGSEPAAAPEAPEPAPAKRARTKAAAPAEAAAPPAAAGRSRKKAAAEPAAPAEPAPAKRSRKKAAEPAEPAPAKRTRKRAAPEA